MLTFPGHPVGIATRAQGVLPPIPEGFAFVVLSDGSYEVWPDGSYVVEYIG